MEMTERWQPTLKEYCPLKAGSIDGTDSRPHDKAIERAMKALYKPCENVQSDPECTLFIGRLDPMTSESDLQKAFSKYGEVLQLCLVRDIVTGMSKQYAFVEYSRPRYAARALRDANHMHLDGREILVEYECGRILAKWVPRRLGGGFGGKKESGQLRFGGADRPFRRPIIIGKEGASRGGFADRPRADSGDNPRWEHADRLGRSRTEGDRRYDRRADREREAERDGRGERDRPRDRDTDRRRNGRSERDPARHGERDTGRRRGRDGDGERAGGPSRRADLDGGGGRDGDRRRRADRSEDGRRQSGTLTVAQRPETVVKQEPDSPSATLLITNIKQEKL